MTNRSILRSYRVELPTGTAAADVVIQSGEIQSIDAHGTERDDSIVRDIGSLTLLPGLVDTHVHLNEPGRTNWEGFNTGTSAAKAGGITTLVDMPLNSSPVTTTIDALKQKRDAARGKIHVDVGFHTGLIPTSVNLIQQMIDAGALAAKAFLCHSGIDEFPNVTESDLQIAMPMLAARNVPLLVHAELEHGVPPLHDPRRYVDYLHSRPPSFEQAAVELMIRLARETKCHVHIVHLSDANCLPMIEAARSDGVRLTVETCPHYLFFEAESVADGRTDFKCAPPIRGTANRDRLWNGLVAGLIDMVVSDHSPCPPAMKHLDRGRFDQAWGGISSLQLGLPIVWTAARRRGLSISDVVRWMSVAPARLLDLPQGIEPGKPAHLVVFDPDQRWIVEQTKLMHRHPLTPYHGSELRGVIVETFVHGSSGTAPVGKLL